MNILIVLRNFFSLSISLITSSSLSNHSKSNLVPEPGYYKYSHWALGYIRSHTHVLLDRCCGSSCTNTCPVSVSQGQPLTPGESVVLNSGCTLKKNHLGALFNKIKYRHVVSTVTHWKQLWDEAWIATFFLKVQPGSRTTVMNEWMNELPNNISAKVLVIKRFESHSENKWKDLWKKMLSILLLMTVKNYKTLNV